MFRLFTAAFLLFSATAASASTEPGFLARLSDDVFWPAPAEALPAWQAHATPFVPGDKPMIAIVIDDMGLDRKRSARALKLPAPVTMAYLPYARDIQKQVDAAKEQGHEIIVHLPMQPGRKTANPGPDYLDAGLPPDEVRRRVVKNLSAFTGYVGVNNHMGSKFTCCAREGVEVLMEEIAERGLLFLDSKTSAASIAEETARSHDIPATGRDVFIDDEETFAFTRQALRSIERTARKTGSAVAIGHPREITLKALNEWLPTLEKKGFQLVPLTVVTRHRMDNPRPAIASAKTPQPAVQAP